MSEPSSPTALLASASSPTALLASASSPTALLASALEERLSIIADRVWYARDAAGHLNALMRVSDRIVAVSQQLPPPVHPQLKHYLERCSYDKALAFLSGKAPEESAHAH